MNDEVKRFFDSINFIYNEEIFKNVIVTKVILNKVHETFKVYLRSEDILPFDDVVKLYDAEKNGINGKNCKIYLEYNSYNDNDILNYVNILLEKLIDKKPSLMGIKENEVIVKKVKLSTGEFYAKYCTIHDAFMEILGSKVFSLVGITCPNYTYVSDVHCVLSEDVKKYDKFHNPFDLGMNGYTLKNVKNKL